MLAEAPAGAPWREAVRGRIADVSLVETSIAAAAWEAAEYLETGNAPQPPMALPGPAAGHFEEPE